MKSRLLALLTVLTAWPTVAPAQTLPAGFQEYVVLGRESQIREFRRFCDSIRLAQDNGPRDTFVDQITGRLKNPLILPLRKDDPPVRAFGSFNDASNNVRVHNVT